jgi:nucleoside-diphosphate-sugar epimerase
VTETVLVTDAGGRRVTGAVLVTGAGGFLGLHVCHRLAAAGWAVRAAVRSSEPPAGSTAVRITGSESGSVLRELVRDCDAVVHLAGRAHVLRETAVDLAAFYSSNTDLTRRVAEAAVAAGVRTFVLMSSVAAVSNARTRVVSDATSDAADTAYGVSKWEAENALAEVAHGADIRAVVLRPPLVYGEGMRGLPLRLFRQLARGLPFPVARPKVRRSMMYAGNLADAVLVTLTRVGLHGRFCVTDGEVVTIDEFARSAATALGRRAHLVPIPAWTLRLAGTIGEIAGHALPVPIDRGTMTRLSQSLIVDGTRFARMAGFDPPVSGREAIEHTARWVGDLVARNGRPRAGSARRELKGLPPVLPE